MLITFSLIDYTRRISVQHPSYGTNRTKLNDWIIKKKNNISTA